MSLKFFSFFSTLFSPHYFNWIMYFILSFFKIWNTSQICTSSLLRGCAHLPSIIPILVYMLLKQALYHSIFKLTDLIDSFRYPLHPTLRPVFVVFVVVTAHLGIKFFRVLYSFYFLLRRPIFSFVSSMFIIGNVSFLTQHVQTSWLLTWPSLPAPYSWRHRLRHLITAWQEQKSRSSGEGHGDPLQHSAWRISWTQERRPEGRKELDTTEVTAGAQERTSRLSSWPLLTQSGRDRHCFLQSLAEAEQLLSKSFLSCQAISFWSFDHREQALLSPLLCWLLSLYLSESSCVHFIHSFQELQLYLTEIIGKSTLTPSFQKQGGRFFLNIIKSILHSYQRCTMVAFSPCPYQHLFSVLSQPF